MKKYNYKKIIVDWLFVITGCILVAFAITSILKTNGLVTGGLTGISIMLDKLIHINYTYIYYLLSILVLILAWITLGKREGLKIITLSLIFPIILIVFQKFNFCFIKDDMMLASIYYGIICGIGSGLILKRGFSQGGTDTIAKILHKKVFFFVSLSEIMLGIDSIIVAASAVVFNKNIALYAIISQIIIVKVIDMVLFGFGSKKVKVEIISDKHQIITNYIMNNIKRGVSICEIKGGYRNLPRIKTFTICSPRESMLIKRFIAETDQDAFITVIPVISVWGMGTGFDSLVDEQ
jgi:uncharacterized membrane-anchored protein YitT (DUF2179 family)